MVALRSDTAEVVSGLENTLDIRELIEKIVARINNTCCYIFKQFLDHFLKNYISFFLGKLPFQGKCFSCSILLRVICVVKDATRALRGFGIQEAI
jgi:hypothetical protein